MREFHETDPLMHILMARSALDVAVVIKLSFKSSVGNVEKGMLDNLREKVASGVFHHYMNLDGAIDNVSQEIDESEREILYNNPHGRLRIFNDEPVIGYFDHVFHMGIKLGKIPNI